MAVEMKSLIGTHDLVWIVLDALRYDVAAAEMEAGRLPSLRAVFPGGWERRHSPGSFTYPAHLAFFAGFLPTPAEATGSRVRHFAARFAGSETTGPGTWCFEEADVVHALAAQGYHTVCVGGVGFFNKQSALSRVLPDLFAESHWSVEMGVTGRDSAEHQFALAARRLGELPPEQRVFLFINVSAIHQPNCHFLPGRTHDDVETHAAALRAVDRELPTLLEAIRRRGPAHLIALSDHGTLYGEEGFTGHRCGHPAIYTVPYAEALLSDVPSPLTHP
jgi:hypothetical protein